MDLLTAGYAKAAATEEDIMGEDKHNKHTQNAATRQHPYS